ncbi:hypothetical protein [Halioxenophilus sp. WMMB6]|uniref:hypothetical protein n=1 Tax=Halioxenophilus sp. WMMB6 TaxID=3073815 RepID=UPI00295EF362|nr:hypothetical protein [Halioxenophilus sp. WMMB6]
MSRNIALGSGLATEEKVVNLRDCGEAGCDIDWLSSQTHEAEIDDVMAFTEYAMSKGWGDGLPLVPPTETRVRTMLAANNRYADEVICQLPPIDADCTVEKIAINAVMAGAPAEGLPLIIAALEAMAAPNFELFGLNATTAPVIPLTLVNGDIRNRLNIPYKHGCLGGTASTSVAIGRAIRLIIKNIAGQEVGVTCQTTFGSPGRIPGILFGEWEERSPWAPFAERRGIKGDAVSVYGTMGTQNIIDTTSQKGQDFVEMIGKSLAYPGANGFSPAMPYAEMMVAINPVWAEILHRDIPNLEDIQELIWRHASIDADYLTTNHRQQLEAQDRVINGRVYVAVEPKDVLVVCCGGTGGLHATGFHSFGSCITQTRKIMPGPDSI